LLDWAESPSLTAPVFARLLGARDSVSSRARITELLFSGIPEVKAQVAIGLGNSTVPSAASLLAQAYAYEAQPSVRRAIMAGIASRVAASESGRADARSGAEPASSNATRRSSLRFWLEQASKLDPDSIVRTIARRGLAGFSSFPSDQGHLMLWLRVTATSESFSGIRPVLVVLPDGSLVVGVTAPDGDALVPSMAHSLVSVRADNASLRPQPAPSMPTESPQHRP
jgi:hypothetical protein